MAEKSVNEAVNIIEKPLDKEEIKTLIHEIRGRRVMLDRDIAVYYGVTTGNLNRAMKRNIKRFPEDFCFQLTDEEISRCQIGISMQKEGVKGGRTYKPYVYSEQGVAMLTSVLHTERAIEASVQIMQAFVEMSHYLSQNRFLVPQDELIAIERKQYQLADRVQTIENNMVTRADFSYMMKLFESGIHNEEVLLLNGEPFKADMAYQRIYQRARKNIIIVDDYLGIKTLQHLAQARNNVAITIISDNKGNKPLRKTEYSDYRREYPEIQIKFIKSENKVHDRYIVLDYGERAMKVYHCGASSKDAGRGATTIAEIKSPKIYKGFICELLSNNPLTLT